MVLSPFIVLQFYYLDVGNYLEIKYPTLGVRFIAIQENVDTLKEIGTEMMPFNNISLTTVYYINMNK